jgi:hypothetical protein
MTVEYLAHFSPFFASSNAYWTLPLFSRLCPAVLYPISNSFLTHSESSPQQSQTHACAHPAPQLKSQLTANHDFPSSLFLLLVASPPRTRAT